MTRRQPAGMAGQVDLLDLLDQTTAGLPITCIDCGHQDVAGTPSWRQHHDVDGCKAQRWCRGQVAHDVAHLVAQERGSWQESAAVGHLVRSLERARTLKLDPAELLR